MADTAASGTAVATRPAQPSAASAATGTDGTGGGWMVPMLVLMIGSFMAVLDSSIVNAAIPTMKNDLGASFDGIAWVSTGYTLALGVVVPVSNWLGERIGATLAHRLSMIGFALASALCGLAWNLDSLIVFRVLQAIPGGILPVMTLTILYRIVPREKIGSAMGIYGLGVIVAPAIGPTLGGYIVEYVDWRLIFYINVPIGLLGAVAAAFILPKMPRTETHRFDWLGFITIGYGLFALLLATSNGADWGWGSYSVLGLVVSGLLSLALFAVIENEVDHPLINLRTLANWPFVNSLLIISVLSIGLFSISYYLPLFLQNGQGFTPLNSGLMMLPQAVAMAIMMPFAGRIYDKFGPRWPALIGLSIAAYGTYLLTGINVDMTRQEVVVWTIVRAIGTGLAMMPIMTAGLNALPAQFTGYGSAINNIAQRVSASLGLAGMGALVTHQSAELSANQSMLVSGNSTLPQLQQFEQSGRGGMLGLWQQIQLHVQAMAYSNVFLVATILTGACVLLAVSLRKPRPVPAPAPSTVAPAPSTVAGDPTTISAQVLASTEADRERPAATTWEALPATEFEPDPEFTEERTPARIG
jgi:EmrB/QacA subfamily drug resistance transporter